MSLIEWIELPNLGDDRGSLMVLESNKNVPFKVKRIYYILDAKPDIPRGFHAHKELIQLAFCIKGSCNMIMDNGIEKQQVRIDKFNVGLMIPPMVWHEMHDFSEDCVMLVLASAQYDEADYIRDYEVFKDYSKISLKPYDEEFLEKSWEWLNDEELKYLTMTPNFTRKDQKTFFNSLELRSDYLIFGIDFCGKPIGACGLKNLKGEEAELWLYIGDKDYWGKGLGKKIMTCLENKAVEEGLTSLYLKVLKENKRAIGLYNKISYVATSENEEYIIMRKEI